MTVGWTHTGYAQQIIFGLDAIDRVDEVVKETGARKVLLVTTSGRRQSPAAESLISGLGRRLVAVFDGVRPHVPTSAVQSALRVADSADIDGIVSFGGGSCADLAKAVCFFIEQRAGRPGTSYLDRPVVAHVAIPTTYSGAELTPFFGMTDEAAHRKSGAGGPTIAPMAAIYDPRLTLTTPARVAAETGMNALAHGIECAYSPSRTPEAEAIALATVRRVTEALPSVIDEPGDVAARTAMLEAAVLGGRCLQNASMGAHHGLAQLIGGRTGIPHGLANAILLAHVLRWNAPAVPVAAHQIAMALTGAADPDGPGDLSDPGGAVDRLRQRIGLPGRLSEVGVTAEDIEAVARMSSGNANVARNPRPMSPDDARAILELAF